MNYVTIMGVLWGELMHMKWRTKKIEELNGTVMQINVLATPS